MRVLHLTLSLARGGRRQAIASLISGLQARGVECHVATLEELGCERADLDAWGDHAEPLERISLFDWRALARLRQLCRSLEVDVLHAHDAASQFSGALVRLALPRLALLMTFHRSLPFESATIRDRLRNALSCSLSGAIVTASAERQRHFIGQNWITRNKVLRIPLGVDLRAFAPQPAARLALRQTLGLPSDALLCGAAGHFGPEKGMDVVLRAWRAVPRLHGRAALVVFGSGSPDRTALLSDLAAGSEGPGPVLFQGHREDIASCLPALDLFIHAPRLEAFGLVITEAMACGVPVVATNIGGIPDIVRDGENGRLVEPGSPHALSDAIEELLAAPESLRTMGRTARMIAEAEFGVEKYARRYESLYEILQRGAPLHSFLEGCEAR